MSVPWLRNGTSNGQYSENGGNSAAASVWSEHIANDNRVYYWNSETKQSSWEKPDVLKTAEERSGKPSARSAAIASETIEDWKEYETPEGKKYYHNHTTNVTTWDKPDILIAAEKSREHELLQEAKNADADDIDGNDFDETTRQELERLDRIQLVGADGKAISAAMYALSDEAVPVFKTPELAEEAFAKMLKRVGVQTDWSWEQTMKAAIKEPVWRALSSSGARKSAFEQYIIDLKKATVGKQKDRIEKLKRDFELMLLRHDEIKSYSQWQNVKANLEGEVAYKAAIDEEEREALFEMYTEKLQEREEAEEKELRQKGLKELAALFRDMNLDVSTTWAIAEGALLDREEYKTNALVKNLKRADTLLAFEQHFKILERQRSDESKQVRSAKRRQQRENRTNFCALLSQLRSSGDIYAGMKWKDAYQLIKDTSAFSAIAGQPGSTPMDFYWDIRDEMDQDLKTKRYLAQDVLDERGEQVKISTNFQDFQQIMQSDDRTANISQQDLNSIYTQLYEKAQRRAEEDKKNDERRLRRKQDDLRSAMKKLDPPIDVRDTYEKVKIRISMLAEFTALESEPARQAAFDKYIRRLKERIEEDAERASRRDRHSHRHSPRNSPVRDRRHDRRSSRDSRRSGNDEREHDSRRRHRSERQGSLEYDPRSPKRVKQDVNTNGARPQPVDEPMLDYGEDKLVRADPTAKEEPTKHDSTTKIEDKNHVEKGADDSSEDGEIAE